MARNGKVNFQDLDDFRQKIKNNLGEQHVQAFIESCAKELAARLLGKVIDRTIVGVYPEGSGKNGGTLRRGWTAKTEEEAQSGGKPLDARVYANSLKVQHYGGTYVIEITNPVHYASYVEFGHRQEVGRYVPALGKRLKKGWVKGKFMLTISEQELQTQAPSIIEKKLTKYLGECFNGK